MKSKIYKWIKIVCFGLLGIFILAITGLFIYSRNPYTPLDEMHDQIETIDDSTITIEYQRRATLYLVDDPMKQIIFVPGGLVEWESYAYLAMSLASEGYNVTIVKPWFHLAIASPNLPSRYIDENLDNVIIGHSLGGVVASMTAAANPSNVTHLILLASYPTRDVSDIETLMITAENDLVLDQDAFNDGLDYVSEETDIIDIEGGNHAGFGWYGPQKDDGEAEISTLNQQNQIIQLILSFIE